MDSGLVDISCPIHVPQKIWPQLVCKAAIGGSKQIGQDSLSVGAGVGAGCAEEEEGLWHADLAR